MSNGSDWVTKGLEAIATAAFAPVGAAVDFVVNGGEFSDEGRDMAFNAITPGASDIIDGLTDD